MWSEWVRATETPLTPDVVLTGRDEDQMAVLKWLRGSAGFVKIQAEAPDEAVAGFTRRSARSLSVIDLHIGAAAWSPTRGIPRGNWWAWERP